MAGRLVGGACAPSGRARSGTLLVRAAARYVRPGGGLAARLGAPRHWGARHATARRAELRSRNYLLLSGHQRAPEQRNAN